MNTAASPLSMKAVERESPPPKRMRIPHGILEAHSQFMVKTPSLAFTGSRKRRMAPAIAMVAS